MCKRQGCGLRRLAPIPKRLGGWGWGGGMGLLVSWQRGFYAILPFICIYVTLAALSLYLHLHLVLLRLLALTETVTLDSNINKPRSPCLSALTFGMGQALG